MREWGGNGRARGATQKCHSWRPLSVRRTSPKSAASKECTRTRKEPALALTSSFSSSSASVPTWVSSSPLEAKTNFHGNGRNQFGVRHREKTRAHDGASERGRRRAPFVERQKKANHSQAPCPDSEAESGSTWERHPSIRPSASVHSVGVQAEWACVRNRSSLHDDYYAAKIRRQATERMRERACTIM